MPHWHDLCIDQYTASRSSRFSTLTSRISVTPEYHGSVLVVGVSKHFVKLNGKAVQMTDVERAKVGVEGIVEQGVVDGEVEWWVLRGGCCRLWTCLGS